MSVAGGEGLDAGDGCGGGGGGGGGHSGGDQGSRRDESDGLMVDEEVEVVVRM